MCSSWPNSCFLENKQFNKLPQVTLNDQMFIKEVAKRNYHSIEFIIVSEAQRVLIFRRHDETKPNVWITGLVMFGLWNWWNTKKRFLPHDRPQNGKIEMQTSVRTLPQPTTYQRKEKEIQLFTKKKKRNSFFPINEEIRGANQFYVSKSSNKKLSTCDVHFIHA